MGTDVKPALSRCIKTYDSVGEWGIKIRYNASTSTGIKPRLGYLPYLGHLNGGAGPLVRLDVIYQPDPVAHKVSPTFAFGLTLRLEGFREDPSQPE